jgi:hypothetical protein
VERGAGNGAGTALHPRSDWRRMVNFPELHAFQKLTASLRPLHDVPLKMAGGSISGST